MVLAVASVAVPPATAAPSPAAATGPTLQVALTLKGSATAALSFAAKQGLHVDLVNDRVVLLSGPASRAAAAFAVRLRPVAARWLRGGPAAFLAPVAAPVVPPALHRSVVSVVGLDSRPLFHRHAVPIGYTGSDLSGAYAATGLTGQGAGITVATVQFDGWNPNDAATYAAAAGLPLGSNQISTVQMPGSSTVPDGSGGDQEAALDVEAVLASAPKAAQRVYVAPNSSAGAVAVYAQIADDVRAGQVQVVSTSWGSCEANYPSSLLQQLADQINGIVQGGGTIFAASGDKGAYDCATPAVPDGRLTVDFPASLPSVVAVGGTRLTASGGGSYAETGWGPQPTTTAATTFAGLGSGGGSSAVYPRPSYQASLGAAGTGRLVPDVSALADPNTGFGGYAASAGGWRLFGGTSLAAPLWAGQLASALATAGRTTGLGDIHAALYAAPSAFRDVTSGANGYYSAGPGYDEVTGLGSPQWTALYNALGLNAPTTSPTTAPAAPTSSGGATSVAAGGSASAPVGQPIDAVVTTPVAGSVSFSPVSSPVSPARMTAMPFGWNITGPSAPLTITLTPQATALPAGALAPDLQVIHDGSVVAACSGSGGECVSQSVRTAQTQTFVVSGAGSGVWTFAAARVTRIAGLDRLGTAIAVSQAGYAAGTAPAAVLARSDGYADALCGAPLAAAKGGPLLLTGSAGLATATAAELTRAVAPGGTVYLLGGVGALSSAVADQVTALGFTVVRLAGADRFATATAIATAVNPTGPILLTTGLSFPDALAAGAAAAHVHGAVLLTAGDTPATATQTFLAARGATTLYAVGGPAARAYPQAIPVVGADRYATAIAVASTFFPGAGAAALASGVSFPDALAAGPLMGAHGVPLLLSGGSTLASALVSELTAAQPATVHVFGGLAALSGTVVDGIWLALG